MAKVDMWPFEVTSDNGQGKYKFSPVSLTVREVLPSLDGTSQAGRVYHIPPRLTFEEDSYHEEWAWTDWVDGPDGTRKKIDHEDGFPIPGDIVSVTLQANPKNTGGHFRDILELTMQEHAGTDTAKPQPPVPAVPAVPADTHTGESALGRLPVEQRIAATALTNVVVGRVWDETPDGDEWKETLRAAVKKLTLAQVPPSLLSQIQIEEPEPEPEPAPAPAPGEDVEELPW